MLHYKFGSIKFIPVFTQCMDSAVYFRIVRLLDIFFSYDRIITIRPHSIHIQIHIPIIEIAIIIGIYGMPVVCGY